MLQEPKVDSVWSEFGHMIEGIGKAFEVAIKDMIHLCEREDSKERNWHQKNVLLIFVKNLT